MVGARIDPQEICSVPIFLSDLAKLSKTEQRAVMSTVLLAQLLDGEISKVEIETWQRIFMAVGMIRYSLRFPNHKLIASWTASCACARVCTDNVVRQCLWCVLYRSGILCLTIQEVCTLYHCRRLLWFP